MFSKDLEPIMQPLHFAPIMHSMIWGGSRIAEFKGTELSAHSVGESWELSGLSGQESVVDRGELRGKTITELAGTYGPALLGTRVFEKTGARFPLIIKIIDALKDLSVQVHPDDKLARRRHGSCGKSEAWYVLDAQPGAIIHLGFKDKLSRRQYNDAVADGKIMEHIASYESAPGDSFFVPAGRVHVIGAGNLLVEVQQCCDITYRIFDYNRRDADGNLRPLHTEQACDALDFSVSENYRNDPTMLADGSSCIIDCQHFSMVKMDVDGSLTLPSDPESFTALMSINGTLQVNDTVCSRGDTLLIAALAPHTEIKGHGTILVIKA